MYSVNVLHIALFVEWWQAMSVIDHEYQAVSIIEHEYQASEQWHN